MGVGVVTVNRDIQLIRAEWRTERQRDAAEHITDEVARLATAEAAIWPDVLAGKLPAIGRLLSIMDRRAKYLGLDSATKATGDLTIKVEYVDSWQPATDRNVSVIGSPN